MKVLYFGCIGDVGHYLWDGTRLCHRSEWGFDRGDLDSPFPPKETEWRGHPFHRRGVELPQGHAAMYHIEKGDRRWTVLAFWDRSIDHRSGSHSTWLVEGHHDYDTARAACEAAYPHVWARYTFEVKLVRDHASHGR